MKLTIPNLLSIARMGLVPLFIIAIVDGHALQALVIFVVAGVTDALDGLIARFFGQQSTLGAYLDPAADKLLLTAAYLALALPGTSLTMKIPVWVTVLVIARDVVIVIMSLVLYLASGIKSFSPTWISKLTTAVQIITVAVVLLAGVSSTLEIPSLIAIYLTAALTIASGLNYIRVANRMVGARESEPRESESPSKRLRVSE